MHKVFTYLSKPCKLAALAAVLCAGSYNAQAQGTKLRVLFVGNSFSEMNNMPVIMDQIARSMGDTIIYDYSTPGGQTFEGHSTDAGTLGKISKGDWHYVVLQDQGQRPALSDADVAAHVTPYARTLDSLVHDKNKCGRSVFFMTWGYKDGDITNCASFPPVCTFKGMDSLLNKRYTEMAMANNALLAPVGEVFRELLSSASFLNLYAPDHINPSDAGSYVTAMTIYTLLFRKDPMTIPFNMTLTPPEAAAVKHAVQSIVFSALPKWHVGEYDPKVGFSSSVVANTVTFNSSSSINIVNYDWDFGDGGTSDLANPVHTYSAVGTYHVTLRGDNCIMKDSAKRDVDVLTVVSVDEQQLLQQLKLYPNPAGSQLYLDAAAGLSLQDAIISIRDLTGRKVYNNDQYNGQPLQIGGLAPGIYLLHISTGSGAGLSYKFAKD